MVKYTPSQEDQVITLHNNASGQQHGPADGLRIQFNALKEGHGPLIVCSSLGGEAEIDELGVNNGRAPDSACVEGECRGDLIGIRLLPRHGVAGGGMWLCSRGQREEKGGQREEGASWRGGRGGSRISTV